MCGIAGIIDYRSKKVSKNKLKSMIKVQRNRGPDDEGYLIKNNFGFGHCRLAIIDLESGQQPMSNPNNTVSITFNGEIYNYKELKKQLEKAGMKFQTNSDTEVILKGYELWGRKVVKKLNGMFSFAISDSEKDEIFLARDRFGIKPLYYMETEHNFSFSSNINSFKALETSLSLNINVVPIYFTQSFIPCPDTIYQEIKKLPPGYILICSTKTNRRQIYRYWNPRFTVSKLSKAEAIDLLDYKMHKIGKNNIISDVSFGAFLSGGIDSTIVLDYVSSNASTDINSFNIDFNNSNFSEYKYAKYVSDRLSIKTSSYQLKHKYVSKIEKIIDFYGEPFGDSSIIPTHFVSNKASKKFKMVISGDGGDELFGGYANYYDKIIRNIHPSYGLKKFLMNRNALNAIKCLGRMFMPKYSHRNRFDFLMRKDLVGSNFSLLNGIDQNQFIYQNKYISECHSLAKRSNNFFDYLQIIDLTYRLSNDFLTKVDIASMDNSLEVRPIMLDNDIASLALSLQLDYRISLKRKKVNGKIILKDLLKNKRYDSFFINRNKKGFTIPLDSWFREKNTARVMFEDYMSSTLIKNLFNLNQLSNIVEEHDRGRDNSKIMWYLLVLFVWLYRNDKTKF